MNPRALLHRTSVASHRARAGRGSLLDDSATSSAIDPAGARSGRQGAAPRRAVVACGAPGARSGAAGRALTTLARSVGQNECPITAGQLQWSIMRSRVDATRATPRAPSRAHRRLRRASRRPLPATRLLRPAARSPRHSRARARNAIRQGRQGRSSDAAARGVCCAATREAGGQGRRQRAWQAGGDRRRHRGSG